MPNTPDSMSAAQRAYDKTTNPKKVKAGLHEPQHHGKRVVPVLEETTLREIYSVIENEEIVVIATIQANGDVEYGMLQGTGDTSGVDSEDASLDITMGEMIHKALAEGDAKEYPFGSSPEQPTEESK